MAPLRAFAPLLFILTLGACGNPCLEMCQQYERYIAECGYGWSTTFAEEGWTSIDDCYDEYWEPSKNELHVCEEETERWARRSCY